MLCTELGDAVGLAMYLESELDAGGLCDEGLWKRWCPPAQYCGYAFAYIGAMRASPKMATLAFILLERLNDFRDSGQRMTSECQEGNEGE